MIIPLVTRLKTEMEQGARIASNAERIWGWSTPAGRLRAKRRIDMISGDAEIAKAKCCLELGCGTGVFTMALPTTQAKSVAIDVSFDLLQKAQDKMKNYPIAFLQGDAHQVPFKDNQFDFIFGVSILHHLNFKEALHEIYRVLRPGGKIMFSEPNMLNPQIFAQKKIPWLKKRLGDSPYETAFSRWKLKQDLAEAFFQKIVIIPFDFVHPALPKAMTHLGELLGSVLEYIPLIKEISGSLFITANKTRLTP